MTFLASDILTRVGQIALDEDVDALRWTLTERCRWLNDGLRETVILKPTASSANVSMELEAGTLQSLDPEYNALLRVVRNLNTTGEPRDGGRAIRLIARDILDAQEPNWHDTLVVEHQAIVKHYIFDEMDPRNFYVYPGNDGTGIIEAVVSRIPATVAVGSGADPEVMASYTVSVDMLDIYQSALVDYVLYRAFSKDADFAGNLTRAAGHYTQFSNALGLKAAQEAGSTPNPKAGVSTT